MTVIDRVFLLWWFVVVCVCLLACSYCVVLAGYLLGCLSLGELLFTCYYVCLV